MKELIYSRNAVYETLSAKRRQVFSIEIAEGVQENVRQALEKMLDKSPRDISISIQGIEK